MRRIRIYTVSIAALWVMAAISLYAGGRLGFTPRLMGFAQLAPLGLLAWTAFAILACASIVSAFKAFGFRESELMRQVIPVTRSEKSVFLLLALSAGVCEEVTFRSFLVPMLMFQTQSLYLAVTVSSLVFGALHMHQRVGGAVRATMLGAILCVPLIVGGSIYPSMIAHTIIDIAGGLWLAPWLTRVETTGSQTR